MYCMLISQLVVHSCFHKESNIVIRWLASIVIDINPVVYKLLEFVEKKWPFQNVTVLTRPGP